MWNNVYISAHCCLRMLTGRRASGNWNDQGTGSCLRRGDDCSWLAEPNKG